MSELQHLLYVNLCMLAYFGHLCFGVWLWWTTY